MVIVPRMLAKTAYDWPFEICEMDDPRPKMLLCTAGMVFEDAEAAHMGLTAYLAAYDAAQDKAENSPVESKAVQQDEVEDKAVAGPAETKAEAPPAEPTTSADVPAEEPSEAEERPGVNFPPEARRQRGR